MIFVRILLSSPFVPPFLISLNLSISLVYLRLLVRYWAGRIVAFGFQTGHKLIPSNVLIRYPVLGVPLSPLPRAPLSKVNLNLWVWDLRKPVLGRPTTCPLICRNHTSRHLPRNFVLHLNLAKWHASPKCRAITDNRDKWFRRQYVEISKLIPSVLYELLSRNIRWFMYLTFICSFAGYSTQRL